jgi:hypothetical protein
VIGRVARRYWFVTLSVLLLATGAAEAAPMAPGLTPAAASTGMPHEAAGTPGPAVAGELVAAPAVGAPVVDGRVEAVWARARPLGMPLTWGIRGTTHALDVELRALYTSNAIYFLAQWRDAAPSGPVDETANKLTVHWDIDTPAGIPAPACNVACHTAYVDGAGRLAYLHAETIPSGSDEALPAAGAWKDGAWTLEWSRRLVNDNPYDLQFTDLSLSYPFFVKIFERVEGRPDPVSAPYRLVFQRSGHDPAAVTPGLRGLNQP